MPRRHPPSVAVADRRGTARGPRSSDAPERRCCPQAAELVARRVHPRLVISQPWRMLRGFTAHLDVLCFAGSSRTAGLPTVIYFCELNFNAGWFYFPF